MPCKNIWIMIYRAGKGFLIIHCIEAGFHCLFARSHIGLNLLSSVA